MIEFNLLLTLCKFGPGPTSTTSCQKAVVRVQFLEKNFRLVPTTKMASGNPYQMVSYSFVNQLNQILGKNSK